MKRVVFSAVLALTVSTAVTGCTHSPAHRIAECQKKGGTEALCTAAERDYEKAHPLPQYQPTSYDNSAVLQAAYDANAAAKIRPSKVALRNKKAAVRLLFASDHIQITVKRNQIATSASYQVLQRKRH